MRSLLLRLVLVLALLSVSRVHWGMLQSVAWISMTARFAQSNSLSDALDKTFDGQNPCQLCRFINQNQTDQGKATALLPDTRWDLCLHEGVIGVQPRLVQPDTFRTRPLPGLVSNPPDLPPPRFS